jgi:hypothetical protein
MRSVLMHELAHYKRGDLWVNQAQVLLQIFYWYNPLLWVANATLRRLREQAVDEMVLAEMGGEAPAYSAMLLHVAKLALGRPLAALGLMGILEPGRGLTQRIMHIMNRPPPRKTRIGARGFAAVLLLALVALPMGCLPKTESSDSIVCIDNLKQLGVAMRVWENDHNGRLPSDLMSMTNELGTWTILQCPDDKSHHVTSWAQVAAGDVSYSLHTASLSDSDNPQIVVAECPLHHNFLMLDGSVQHLANGHWRADLLANSPKTEASQRPKKN